VGASVGGGAKTDFDASRSRAAAMVAAGLGACVGTAVAAGFGTAVLFQNGTAVAAGFGTAVAAGFGTAVEYSHGVSVVPPQAPIRNKQMQVMKMTLISGNPAANLTP
jgi:hypothetical protein